MDPFDIHYVRTSKGRRVAVGVTGSGPVIVATPGSITTSNLRHSPYRHALIALRDRFTIVTYDHLGAGMSDRDGYDFSPEGLDDEFEAVMNRVDNKPVALFGASSGSQIVIRYAVKHPEMVTCLGLFGGWARGVDFLTQPGFAAYRRGLGESWDIACRFFVDHWAPPLAENKAELVKLLKETTSHAAFLGYIDALAEGDVTEFLPWVTAPTFVPFDPNRTFSPFELSRTLAEGIPGARLQIFHEKMAGHRAFGDFVEEIERKRVPHANGMARVEANWLSTREHQVLVLVAAGKSNREIGDALAIAEATVTRHVHNILTKLSLSNRVEAATWWTRQRAAPESALHQTL